MLRRRGFLKLAGAAAAAPGLSLGCGGDGRPRGRFFDADGWAIVEAATEVIFPADETGPGARDAGVVRYIDNLLSAFDDDPPRIHAGGPFSGRAPFPDATGAPSGDFPDNGFERFLPLGRGQELAWRIRLFGSAATPGGDFNDAVLGPTRGLRDLYAEGVPRLEAIAVERFGGSFVELDALQQGQAVAALETEMPELVRVLVEQTIEGLFSAPEYGGNADLAGWQLARYDGDSQPLGYALFDEATRSYRDRPDFPTSVASPGSMPEEFEGRVLRLLELAALGSGGMRFY